MKDPKRHKPVVGLIGWGAFGRLIVQHLSTYCSFKIYDPMVEARTMLGDGFEMTSLKVAAQCQMIILATPVSALQSVVDQIAGHVRRGALLIDVGSVKTKPARIMLECFPDYVDILCTHPLFGPQSAQDGLRGLKIVLCPLRCRNIEKISLFLSRTLGLEVIQTTPESHDHELAVAQGLTHLIAQVLLKMEPLPEAMTTVSFDLIKKAIHMVKDDSPEVLRAIEQENPFAEQVRETFFKLANEVRLSFENN